MSTIVLVHAIGSSRRAWRSQLQGLGERHRVLAPDLPGHGDAAGPFTLARAVETVRVAIGEHDGPAHVVGISGGAVVALLTCLQLQERMASLVLSAGLAATPWWFMLQRAVAAALPEPVLERVVRRQYSGGRPALAGAASEDFRRAGKGTYVAALRELAAVDVRSRLDEIAVPTLVLCGSWDKANIPASRELAAGIHGAELRLVPGAGHLWNLQQPDVFTRTVGEFAEEVDSTRS